MQSESLDHSLDGGHANPCLLANELRAGAGGSGPRLTFKLHLPSPAHQGLSRLDCGQLSFVLGGPVCGPPPHHSCCGAYTSNSQTPVPCAADVSAVPTPPLRSHCQQRLLSTTLSPAAAIFPPDITAGRSLSGTSLLPCLPQRSTTGSQVARRELVAGRAATPVSLGSKHLLARGRKESRRPRLFRLPWRSPEPFLGSRVGHRLQWKRNVVESR